MKLAESQDFYKNTLLQSCREGLSHPTLPNAFSTVLLRPPLHGPPEGLHC